MGDTFKTVLYIAIPVVVLIVVIVAIVCTLRLVHKRRMASLMGQNDLEHFYHDDHWGTSPGDGTLKVCAFLPY